jgi:hypothetical protein
VLLLVLVLVLVLVLAVAVVVAPLLLLLVCYLLLRLVCCYYATASHVLLAVDVARWLATAMLQLQPLFFC